MAGGGGVAHAPLESYASQRCNGPCLNGLWPSFNVCVRNWPSAGCCAMEESADRIMSKGRRMKTKFLAMIFFLNLIVKFDFSLIFLLEGMPSGGTW